MWGQAVLAPVVLVVLRLVGDSSGCGPSRPRASCSCWRGRLDRVPADRRQAERAVGLDRHPRGAARDARFRAVRACSDGRVAQGARVRDRPAGSPDAARRPRAGVPRRYARAAGEFAAAACAVGSLARRGARPAAVPTDGSEPPRFRAAGKNLRLQAAANLGGRGRSRRRRHARRVADMIAAASQTACSTSATSTKRAPGGVRTQLQAGVPALRLDHRPHARQPRLAQPRRGLRPLLEGGRLARTGTTTGSEPAAGSSSA